MSFEIKVPRLAESISEATLVEWLKADGQAVRMDEPVATLETDKAAVEIVADGAGVLRHARKVGETVNVGDLLGRIEEGAAATAAPAAAAAPAAPAAPVAAPPPARPGAAPPAPAPARAGAAVMPAARRVLAERGIPAASVTGSGKGGRVTKEDAERHEAPAASPAAEPPRRAEGASVGASNGGGERLVPMSRIRLRIAERLVHAQQTAAILTTFNEVDMSRVMDARARHKEAFEKKHGVRLGFMSFFARACALALAEVPNVNASIRGDRKSVV